MSQEVQERLGLTTPSGEVVNLFPDLDPVYNSKVRLMVTAYLGSGVSAPGGSHTPLRECMTNELVRAYGLCGPHAVTRAPINLDVHDQLDYAKLIRNPYIVRIIHVSVAAYFNKLPLTYSIANNLIHDYIEGGVEDGIAVGLEQGWLKYVSETGWPDEMCAIPIKEGDLHLRPTRVGIYRTIEAITWIMDCVHRVDAIIDNNFLQISCSTFRQRWPSADAGIADVVSNSEWQTLGVA